MKIKEVNAPASTALKTFGNVEVGDAFRVGSIIAIKTLNIYNCDNEKVANAIVLSSGKQLLVSDGKEVEVYMGELVFDERDWCRWEKIMNED